MAVGRRCSTLLASCFQSLVRNCECMSSVAPRDVVGLVGDRLHEPPNAALDRQFCTGLPPPHYDDRTRQPGYATALAPMLIWTLLAPVGSISQCRPSSVTRPSHGS